MQTEVGDRCRLPTTSRYFVKSFRLALMNKNLCPDPAAIVPNVSLRTFLESRTEKKFCKNPTPASSPHESDLLFQNHLLWSSTLVFQVFMEHRSMKYSSRQRYWVLKIKLMLCKDLKAFKVRVPLNDLMIPYIPPSPANNSGLGLGLGGVQQQQQQARMDGS
ncbi:PREDICTED: LOC18783871 [Prunus dulcis]|uniref:PREDICTED: LOC18783871 n=1 Tax=Prunus dulcis TaxID=3755 RepID=A0A5E4E8L2_PRUDU|nr:PREDICTED: LOC18783871 [Prunus dulcis]